MSSSSKTLSSISSTPAASAFVGKVLKLVRSKQNLRVAIIGRENVGKSTLFNSLLGKQHSIVHNSPGVTRDCQEAKTVIRLKQPMNISQVVFDKKINKRIIKKISCTFIDTPGANYMDSIIQQTQDTIASSHVALLVTDCKDGLQKWDQHVANYLEMKGIPALHILNKCDGPLMRGDGEELEKVISENTIASLGRPIPVSSEMKLGMDHIISYIQAFHFLTESMSSTALEETRQELYDSVIEKFNTTPSRDYLCDHACEGTLYESEMDALEQQHENAYFQPFRGEYEKLPYMRNLHHHHHHYDGIERVSPSSYLESPPKLWKDRVKSHHHTAEESMELSPQNYRNVLEKKDIEKSLQSSTQKSATSAQQKTEEASIAPKSSQQQVAQDEDFETDIEEEPIVNSSGLAEDNIMRLAIIGRPNVGKSTLLNHIIGEERTRTSSTPGTTRDTIEIEAINEKTGQHYIICDTAGIRKKKYTETDRIEKMSLQDTYRTIKYANVCCLVVDPTHNVGDSNYGLTQQDLDIARMVEKEGRALVIACNKWDLVKQPYVVAQQIESQIESSLAQLQGISVVVCSAKTGKNLFLLLKECEKAYQKWASKIPTNKLNAFIRQYLETKPVPASYPKIRYLSQVAVRPPTFCIHTQNKKFPPNFERQIVNAIREEFDLGGVPFRVIQKMGRRKEKNKEDQ
ncbi:hypothetical protein FDP41_003076 [Naegleria fowleri]|uniref:GTPase Der n=1 Tax=Naegleria fowleri TaxID=5763 RepID=A0A6A5BU26_NAEFO|nr:uncharacterized protein FDP41_003076 [Naegleria fowleri]KAF0977754.1 hypothetical protein FDP41_003076 [Naegleria fowleri]